MVLLLSQNGRRLESHLVCHSISLQSFPFVSFTMPFCVQPLALPCCHKAAKVIRICPTDFKSKSIETMDRYDWSVRLCFYRSVDFEAFGSDHADIWRFAGEKCFYCLPILSLVRFQICVFPMFPPGIEEKRIWNMQERVTWRLRMQ